MKRVSPSTTVAIHSVAQQKKLRGECVYQFAAGDPVLFNHPSITDRAAREIAKGSFPYPPVEGIPELRHLVAEWMNVNYLTQFAKENVLVTCGGKFALFASIYALLHPNDEVLIPAPYWVSYPDMVKMAGGVPKIVHASKHNGWKITPHDLRKQITKNSKMLIFNNACNPTGALYTQAEIKAILDIADEFNLIVISDEVYSGLVYDELQFVSCGSFSEHHERVIVIQSCSKNFGMTGWRVGFVLAPQPIIEKLASFQSQSTTGVNVISQWGAVGALEHAGEVKTYVNQAMKKRRDIFVTTFNSLFPAALDTIASALYAFVPLSSMGFDQTSSVALCEKLISCYNIALVPGIAFGMEGYLRLAFSEPEEEIFKGLHALKRAVEELS